VVYVNSSAADPIGFPAGFQSIPLLDRVHPEDVGRVREGLAPLLAGEVVRSESLVFRFRDLFDEWRHLESVAVDMHLEEIVARTQRSGERIAVCYIDLDSFKPVNDRFGHAAGDSVLIETGERLDSIVRAGDVVARLGGDEFVLVCDPVNDSFEAGALATRALHALHRPHMVNGGEVCCGATIGVAMSQRGDTPEVLLSRADEALYKAKRSAPGTFAMDARLPAG